MHAHQVKRLSVTPESLLLEWTCGGSGEFTSLWLRDNVSEDRDPHSGQRLVDIADLPAEPLIRAATPADGALRIDWQEEARPTFYDLEWLHEYSHPAPRVTGESADLWLEGARLHAWRDFAALPYPTLQEDAAQRAQWLARLLRQGIAFLQGVPVHANGILEAMQWVGRVSATNYGEVFDVRSVAQPENLAYSDLGLGLHTDNPYREPVPGFQALHALVAAPEGGTSLFADGFALARHLRATEPEAFTVLTRTPVPFRYCSADALLYAERPLIQLDCRGEIAAVHYNSRSIAPLRLAAAETRAFYAAYRRFAALLREPCWQLRVILGDGDLVVFDNLRTLHGRTAFSSARHARHLRGCYLTRDSVLSAAALQGRVASAERCS